MLRVEAKCVNDKKKSRLPSDSPSDCSKKCREQENCRFFLFGTGNETGYCKIGHELNDNCQLNKDEHWEDASYDFYEIKGK